MAASFVGAQALRILVGDKSIRCAPFCLQMDMYTGEMRCGSGAKRGLVYKLRRDLFARYFERQLGTINSNSRYERFLDWLAVQVLKHRKIVKT
jgi:hypothetical protein